MIGRNSRKELSIVSRLRCTLPPDSRQATQRRFPFQRKEKFRIVREASFPAFVRTACGSWQLGGLSQRKTRLVRKLLETIEVCSGNNGSDARVEVLAAHMDVSARTVRRAIRLAEWPPIQVIEVTRDARKSGGQGSNNYRINWPKLATMVPGQTGRAAGQTDRAPGQTGRANDISPSPESRSISRTEVWKMLKGAGVRNISGALAHAEQNGLSLQRIAELVEYFWEHRDIYDAGALYRRIQYGVSSASTEEGWTTARPTTATDRARQRLNDAILHGSYEETQTALADYDKLTGGTA